MVFHIRFLEQTCIFFLIYLLCFHIDNPGLMVLYNVCILLLFFRFKFLLRTI